MRTEPIPNDDPECPCHMGTSDDPDAMIFWTAPDIIPGQGKISFTCYESCPLHGQYAKDLSKGWMKGLSI